MTSRKNNNNLANFRATSVVDHGDVPALLTAAPLLPAPPAPARLPPAPCRPAPLTPARLALTPLSPTPLATTPLALAPLSPGPAPATGSAPAPSASPPIPAGLAPSLLEEKLELEISLLRKRHRLLDAQERLVVLQGEYNATKLKMLKERESP